MNISSINKFNIISKCGDLTDFFCAKNVIKDFGGNYINKNYINKEAFINKSKKETCKFLRYLSKNFTSPHQRAVLGITAICTQPFIDLHNKNIKDEDKPVVVSKTLAKIIVGTSFGVAVRHFSIKAVKNFTKAINTGKYSQCLLPQKVVEGLKKGLVHDDYIKNYRNGLGTFLGLATCIITNFLIDAPLTKILTNVLHDKVFKRGVKTNE